MDGVETVELVERVDHDAPHAHVQGVAQLGHGLVVAVQHQLVGRYAGGEGHVDLTPGGHVEVHALLVGEAGHGLAQKGLGGVGHALAEGGSSLATAAPQVELVVHEEGRAELVGQRQEIAPADRQPPVRVDLGRVGQQAERERAHIDSGAATPSRSSPTTRPTRAASTSASRASVRAGDTPSPTT